VQARPDVHETADSSLMPALSRFWFGVDSTFHPPPVAGPGWLARAAPAVTTPAKPTSTTTAPSSRTACAPRIPARDPLPSRLT